MRVGTQTAPVQVGTAALADEKRVRPIVGWAALGVVFIVIELVALSGWLFSGDAQPVDPGPTPLPGYMRWTIPIWEVAGFGILGVFLWYFLVNPARRAGRVTSDGLFCLAMLLTVPWQDTLANYFSPWVVYNAHVTDFGSWNGYIFGWYSPNARYLAEGLAWVVPIYVYLIFGLSMLGTVLMRKLHQRWPQLSNFWLVTICFVTFFAVEIICEPFCMMLGIYVYPGSIPGWTLFKGHYYQFPLYEMVLGAAWWCSYGIFRYFRDDRGYTFAERGIDRVKVTGRRKTTLRFLAVAGLCNLSFLAYNVPTAVIAMHGGPWPEDITKRSYYMGGLCGPVTNYACPAPGTPLSRKTGVHVGADGQLTGANRPAGR